MCNSSSESEGEIYTRIGLKTVGLEKKIAKKKRKKTKKKKKKERVEKKKGKRKGEGFVRTVFTLGTISRNVVVVEIPPHFPLPGFHLSLLPSHSHLFLYIFIRSSVSCKRSEKNVCNTLSSFLRLYIRAIRIPHSSPCIGTQNKPTHFFSSLNFN